MLFTKVSVLICRTEKVKSISDHYHAVRIPDMKITVRAQLFKTYDFVSSGIIKFSIIKYGIYANICAEKM